MDRRRSMAQGSMLLALLLMALGTTEAYANSQVVQTPLPGKSIPKFIDPLPTFVGARVPAGNSLTVTMEEFDQQVLPLPLPKTTVWGYKVGSRPALYPGFTVEAQQNTPTTVTFVNNLVGPNGAPPKLQKYLTVDQTLHWANPLGLNCMMMPLQPACLLPYGTTQPAPVPAVAHLHGGEVPSFYDGHPEAWFTPDGIRGPAYSSATPVAGNAAQYVYPNQQEAATIWFHDHALGMTRLNVYGGLAAFYFMRDGRDTGLPDNPIRLPAGPQEIEMAIQDRLFDTTGQWLFPDVGINPMDHPFWLPEFFGDTIVVNGKTWPFLNVEQRRYRFRIVDGSNARFYQLALVDSVTGAFGPPIWQIGTDGGLLDAPVMLNDPAVLNAGLIKPNFILAPGERADVIIDFTNVPVGTTFVLRNIAKAPFPKGTPADPSTVGQIMQFRVTSPATSVDTSCDPALPTTAANGCTLRAAPIVRLANPATGTPAVAASVKRQLTLVEIMGMGGPLEVLINNTKYNGMQAGMGTPVPGSTPLGPNFMTEAPKVGDTEIWEIVNLTADAHPIHLHLVQFQLLNRQPFQTGKYFTSYSALFLGGAFLPGSGPPLPYVAPNADGALGGNPAVTPFLQGVPVPANPNEAGWKDTVIAYPGQVTRFIVRFAPQHVAAGPPTPGTNFFPFDPTVGPGYVWHCHIIDHEDNEMMRPYAPVP